MKKIYITKETQKIRDILNESYDYFLAALKAKNPGAESLIEMMPLHKLMMRMR